MIKAEGYWRIVDANFNRAKEALRVQEDFSRFFLEDEILTKEYKNLRHAVTRVLLRMPVPYAELVRARDSRRDLGRQSWIQDGAAKPGWREILIANMKRSQEALRVLEELSKIVAPAQARRFQRIRFRLYELEKKCLRKF